MFQVSRRRMANVVSAPIDFRLFRFAVASVVLSISFAAGVRAEDAASDVLEPEPVESTTDNVAIDDLPKLVAPKDPARIEKERAALGGSKPVYGNDDRSDWGKIVNPNVKKIARASAALFSNKVVRRTSDGKHKVRAGSLQQSYGLCADERFAKQLTGAFCSGTLVAPDIVVTAGHCVREVSGDESSSRARDIRFVFGYWSLDKADPGRSEFSPNQVYRGLRVIGGALGGSGDDVVDWAAIKLDRPVPADVAVPVKMRSASRAKIKEAIYVIGYPSGLPLKYAPGAEVRSTAKGFFTANLDTFGGNSGSGVFTKDRDEMVGVLVRGYTDYYEDEKDRCTRAYWCAKDGCGGEDVTHIDIVKLR